MPLEVGGEELRLVILHPGAFSDPIQVSVNHAPFSATQIPEYEALSYVWGSTADPVIVTVVETKTQSQVGILHIGQNLASALKHLRFDAKPRTIWCDALCINQQDLTERSAEVLKMGDIYRNASRVIV